MKKVIYLYWRQNLLIELSYEDDMYVQHILLKKLKKALNEGCPIELLFGKQIEYTIRTKKLPIIFEEFCFSNARVDLVKHYCIEENDSKFDKLYKVALQGEDIAHDEFWISTKENFI